MTETREEILIGRALDRTADAADWVALRDLASRDADVWGRLAADLEAEGRVVDELRGALDRAAEVELPAAAPGRGTQTWTRWLGWAAAAAMLLGWLGDRTPSPPPERPATPGETVVAAPPAAPAGDVVTELPSRMLDTRPAPDGVGFEVLVLRRTVERRHVDALYRLAEDEHGASAPVPVRWTSPSNDERM